MQGDNEEQAGASLRTGPQRASPGCFWQGHRVEFVCICICKCIYICIDMHIYTRKRSVLFIVYPPSICFVPCATAVCHTQAYWHPLIRVKYVCNSVPETTSLATAANITRYTYKANHHASITSHTPRASANHACVSAAAAVMRRDGDVSSMLANRDCTSGEQ